MDKVTTYKFKVYGTINITMPGVFCEENCELAEEQAQKEADALFDYSGAEVEFIDSDYDWEETE